MHKEIRKILVILPDPLGRVINAMSFLGALRHCFPNAGIQWVADRQTEEFLSGHPFIDKIWVVDGQGWKKLSKAGRNLKELKSLLIGIEKEGFDISIDLYGYLRSAILGMASRARMLVGFREAREGSKFLYNRPVEGGKGLHPAERYLRVAAGLGCQAGEADFPLPPVPERSELDTKFFLPERYAVIVPGADCEQAKWPARRFGELAFRLPVESVVVGGPEDREASRTIFEISRGKAAAADGEAGLKETAAIIKGAAFMVSGDSGLIHIAAAYRVPVIGLFGPSDPAENGPYGGIHKVLKTRYPCAPCGRRKKCRHCTCMDSIETESVLEAVREVWPRA